MTVTTVPPVYLFFDTETNGLPQDYNAPPEQTSNWPRMIQLAYLMVADTGRTVHEESCLVKPDGWQGLPAEITQLTGITPSQLELEGRPLADVLGRFNTAVEAAAVVVAHNLQFDMSVVSAEMVRLQLSWHSPPKRQFCTMKSDAVARYCGIPALGGRYNHRQRYKWPKLVELHRRLFGEDFTGAHNALNDVRALARCFFELKKLGVVKL